MNFPSFHPARPTALLFVLLLVTSLAAPPLIGTAAAADASIVLAGLRVLVRQHIDSPDAARLLEGALNGLRQALVRAGITESLSDLTPGDAAAMQAEFQRRFDQAAALASGKLSDTDLQYAAVRGMTRAIPGSHTSFMEPDEWDAKQRRYRNEAAYSGIGTRSVQRDGRFYLLEVFTGSPAAQAGLRPLDRILSIDGHAVDGMSNLDFSNRIRGPNGTTVALAVQRRGESAPLTIPVRRGQIVRPTLEYQLLPGGVGYLRFSQFIPGSATMVRNAVLDLQRQGARGLVLDLRGNSGGRITELNAIAGMLLPQGSTISIREDREFGRSVDTTRGAPIVQPSVPLTVVIDEGSASAAEILTASLQEHGRATIVGAKSAGAVLVSVDVPLPGNTALQVAIRRVLSSRGVPLEGTGVTPDQLVVLTSDDLDRGIDAQYARSVQITSERVAAARRPASAGVFLGLPDRERLATPAYAQ